MECTDYVGPLRKVVRRREGMLAEAVLLQVDGMGCANCAMRVHNSLLALPGVFQVSADHASGAVLVVYNPAIQELVDLADAVEHAVADRKHRYEVVSLFEL